MKMLQPKPWQSHYTTVPPEHKSRDMVTTTRDSQDSQQPEELFTYKNISPNNFIKDSNLKSF